MMKYLVFFWLLAGLTLSWTTATVQPGSGGPGPGGAPTATPLDGGAGLLLVAGATYGLQRLRRKRPQ